MIKHIMIPVAAFMVTATGVSAFNSDILEKINVNLSTSQIEALEESHELREAGDYDAARTVLEEAEIDRDTMHEIRSAMHEYRMEMREAVKEAVENSDYEAFQSAIAETPLAEQITSEEDFEQFVEAHELMADGEFEAAKEIFAELGIEKKGHKGGFGGGHRGGMHKMQSEQE